MGGRPLTCPYTLMGSGCRAALRLLRSGFSSAPRGPPRAHSRSSRGSPCTTRKPRSWGRGARPPGSVCVHTSHRAPGGSSATRVNRKGSRDSLLLLRVAMFGRTLPQVAPPPGENVQREAGTAAGLGPRAPLPGLQAVRAARGRPAAPAAAAAAAGSRLARRGAVTCAARSGVRFAHFPRSAASAPLGPLPRAGMGRSRQRAPAGVRGHARRRAHRVVRPAAIQSWAGARSSSPELVASCPGSRRGRPKPRRVSFPDCSSPGSRLALGPPPQAPAASPPPRDSPEPKKIRSERAERGSRQIRSRMNPPPL